MCTLLTIGTDSLVLTECCFSKANILLEMTNVVDMAVRAFTRVVLTHS